MKEGDLIPRIKDITEQKFNRLTVMKKAESYILPSGGKVGQWLCRCDCGNMVIVKTSHLFSGHTKSCGCYAKEVQIANGKKEKHGLTYSENGKVARIYRIWSQIKTRCFNSNDGHFANYGGRGITICKEWLTDFKAFYDWSMANGYSDELTIDRINVDGNYEPSNCRWATNAEQNRNKRNTVLVTYEGVSKTLHEWSKITGIGYQTLYYRYKTGKAPEEILRG